MQYTDEPVQVLNSYTAYYYIIIKTITIY